MFILASIFPKGQLKSFRRRYGTLISFNSLQYLRFGYFLDIVERKLSIRIYAVVCGLAGGRMEVIKITSNVLKAYVVDRKVHAMASPYTCLRLDSIRTTNYAHWDNATWTELMKKPQPGLDLLPFLTKVLPDVLGRPHRCSLEAGAAILSASALLDISNLQCTLLQPPDRRYDGCPFLPLYSIIWKTSPLRRSLLFLSVSWALNSS